MLLRSFSLFCAFSAFLQAEDIIGKIGSVELPTSEVQTLIASLKDTEEAPAELNPEALDQFVRALLVQRLVLQQAIAEKHDQKPNVSAQILRTRDAAIAESYLLSVSKAPAAYPTEKELAEAYEQNKGSFLVPKSWLLAQIFVSNPKESKAQDAEKRLDSIVKQLSEPSADFASIARVSSDDRNSSANGGELGWLQENLIQPAIRDTLPTLKLNQVSKPIRLDDGWHIIKILDVREANTPALDQVKPQLKARLRAQKAQENRQLFLSKLLEANPPAINGIELLKLKSTP
ncbi:MAG: peptidylprolyl isomerase [Armatimonadetes bacterium]|nr:peptidylprolyl isomerase [Akkermansiaceae bacterium]